ncbi:hypothetical protein NDU88_003851 [Pleurodeles waltl]|uniref:Uncharacterized protein n=1 Tax=Pleurodeles waltl TaxID=8319 RepID=A0AAV7MUN4_PLEWA|nr:hypothetical protein NDU88_003851 [Pleurodeles waltl]
MGIGDVIEERGMGTFQILHIILLSVPALLIPSHNFIQTFSAGVPAHHCRVWTGRNYTGSTNQTGGLLRAFIPADKGGNLEPCSRYTQPQWQLLDESGTHNTSGIETEPCLDGWEYDRSVFTSSIVAENLETDDMVVLKLSEFINLLQIRM